jgi:hypothetical protein
MIKEIFNCNGNMLNKYLVWISLIDKWKIHYPTSVYQTNIEFFKNDDGGIITILCSKN